MTHVIFLILGVYAIVCAAACAAKYVKGLTTLGIVVYLALSVLFAVLGVLGLMGMSGHWHSFASNAALGFLLIMEGTGKLRQSPLESLILSVTFILGGIALLTILILAKASQFQYLVF